MIFDKQTLRTQASFAAGIAELGGHPMLVDGAPRRDRRPRVRRRRRPRARPAVLDDRLAHLRPGPDRGDGGARRGPGRQRAHRRLPPLPAARRPAHRPRAQGHARRAHRRVRRRRRLQHGQLLAARRRDRRHARQSQRSRAASCPTRRWSTRRCGSPTSTDGSVVLEPDPRAAVADADVVVTDTWISMGKEDEAAASAPRSSATGRSPPSCSRLAKPDAIFLHCLPAYRGKEIDRRGDRRSAQRRLGRGGEPPPRPEGDPRLPAGGVGMNGTAMRPHTKNARHQTIVELVSTRPRSAPRASSPTCWPRPASTSPRPPCPATWSSSTRSRSAVPPARSCTPYPARAATDDRRRPGRAPPPPSGWPAARRAAGQRRGDRQPGRAPHAPGCRPVPGLRVRQERAPRRPRHHRRRRHGARDRTRPDRRRRPRPPVPGPRRRPL